MPWPMEPSTYDRRQNGKAMACNRQPSVHLRLYGDRPWVTISTHQFGREPDIFAPLSSRSSW